MNPLELAQQYMDIIFLGGEIENLRPLFTPEFTFNGPFYTFESAEEYIVSLKADPPEGFQYQIIRSYQDESSACLVYQFSKPGIRTMMAQLFEVHQDKISKISLIFDTKAFI